MSTTLCWTLPRERRGSQRTIQPVVPCLNKKEIKKKKLNVVDPDHCQSYNWIRIPIKDRDKKFIRDSQRSIQPGVPCLHKKKSKILKMLWIWITVTVTARSRAQPRILIRTPRIRIRNLREVIRDHVRQIRQVRLKFGFLLNFELLKFIRHLKLF